MSAAKGTTIQRVTGTSTLVRPKFGPGMLLQHDDLEQLATYTRELSRLMFRSLFGCGVVCGLEVKVEQDHCGVTITVDAGLAIDCNGDPVQVPKTTDKIPIVDDCDQALPNSKLWVLLCGSSKCCAPRPSACGSGEETPSVCTRERFGYEIRIVSALPDCFCGLRENERPSCLEENTCVCVNPVHPAYADHYQGKCGCNCGGSDCCCCDCVVLAVLLNKNGWKADHHVRRVTRPVLMCDWLERPLATASSTPQQSSQQTAEPIAQQAAEPIAQQATQPIVQQATPLIAQEATPPAPRQNTRPAAQAARRTPVARRPPRK